MKEVKFNPLRRIKKTGKITVASYMQWRKLMTADYDNFKLVINDNHLTMPLDEYVYRHDGELLFFYKYHPDEIPIIQGAELFNLDEDRTQYGGLKLKIFDRNSYGIRWGQKVNYNSKGMDCDGVPTFSHFTALYIAKNYTSMNDFYPLTVSTVLKWYGWILWQLDNSTLQRNGNPK